MVIVALEGESGGHGIGVVICNRAFKLMFPSYAPLL